MLLRAIRSFTNTASTTTNLLLKSSSTITTTTTTHLIIKRTMSSLNTTASANLFVQPQWLNEHLNNVKVIDASWYMPHENHNIRKEFEEAHIQSAVLFDIDEVCDKTVNLPHNLPSVDFFQQEVGARLGISSDDHVVIYDTRGTYVASARAWWTFLTFGHNPDKLSILFGGLPAWQRAGLPTVQGKIAPAAQPATYKATFNPSMVKTRADLENNMNDKKYQVVDARVADRFYGRVDEPRAGLRRGHIPGALNVPWVEIVNNAQGGYQDKDKVLALFKTNGIDVNKPVLTTCGSGTTAAVLTLGLYSFGYPLAPIYDGSWSEWGQVGLDTPVETDVPKTN
ncbi:hypothetical protein SAMD00019534_067340, partial [Acytostelium subglobosum LB1]|uniref:hypothetical protein n=1 Tax=Acytostelium subglobosum LB1 TaxID=1410327 RepID=UPI000644859C